MKPSVQAAPVGEKFGRLTVIGDDAPFIRKCGRRTAVWRVICQCGQELSVRATSLKRELTKSCGCLKVENGHSIGAARKAHGQSHILGHRPSTEYTAWIAMKQRCYYAGAESFANYGGRGIRVCAEWLNSFETFLADMGPKPESSFSIERIDSDGNYSPQNCKWASKPDQSRNRRNTVLDLQVVADIRALHARTGWGRRKIATHLKLTVGSVEGVLSGKTWKAH